MSATAPLTGAVSLARATSRLLSLGSWVGAFAAALTLAALVALTIGARPAVGWVGAVALGAIALYYALRARLDARLFDEVAGMLVTGASEEAALEALDSTLELRFGAAPRPDRDLADRCKGAVRLLRRASILTLLQLALSALLWLYEPR